MNTLKKYEELRRKLIEYIKENNLKRDDQLPTVREIMRDMGYSYTTVNRTLNEMEKDGIITKRQGKGIFVNRINGNRENLQIALILPRDFHQYKILMGILFGVKEIVEKSDMGLIISISNMSHEKEKESISNLLQHHVDGLVIFLEDQYRRDYSHIIELKEKRVPFVLVDRYIPELETDYVVVNNEEGMFKVCAYLKYNRLCEDILFVYPDTVFLEITSTAEKIKGYKKAMETFYGDNSGTVISLDEFINRLDALAEKKAPIGVCFNHDEMLLELDDILLKEGKHLPDNLHIFGYANSFERPIYPTVEQFNEQLGKKAVEILMKRIKNPDLPVEHIKISPKLILPDKNGSYYLEK
ncbi:GntR family transcriptional regulator [Calditrichota bacterium GD2]